MKTTFRLFSLMALMGVQVCFGQTDSSDAARIGERGLHHRLWQRFDAETNYVLDRVIFHTNSYTELETGLHFLDPSGRWVESRAEIELSEDGAAATNLQFQVFFAANLNAPGTAGAVRLVTPDSKVLRSRILGLSYFDGTKAVLIAETKDSIGLVFAPNRVLYTNAFDNVDGVEADVEYVVSKAGLQQNIIVRSQLPHPSEWGLNPATTRLQVLTEFYDPPEPAKAAEIQSTGLVDEFLDFGAMKITREGKAFSVGEEVDRNRIVPVAKQWSVIEDRILLVEEVQFAAVEEQIQALELRRQGASLRRDRMGQGDSLLAALKPLLPKGGAAQRATARTRMARSERPLAPSLSQADGERLSTKTSDGQLSAFNSQASVPPKDLCPPRVS
jgi:hypothetical protein